MKSTFIKLQSESIPKDIGQELLIVNNGVNVSYFEGEEGVKWELAFALF